MRGNLASHVISLVARFWEGHVRIGIVTGTSGDRVNIRWADQDDPEPRSFARLASYSPTVDDEVLVLKTSASRRSDWIVMDKVER